MRRDEKFLIPFFFTLLFDFCFPHYTKIASEDTNTNRFDFFARFYFSKFTLYGGFFYDVYLDNCCSGFLGFWDIRDLDVDGTFGPHSYVQ